MSEQEGTDIPAAPDGLDAGGRALWTDVVERYHPLTMTQLVQLTEACRAKDRLDTLDLVLRGDAEVWMRLTRDLQCEEPTWNLRITSALAKANETAQSMKQLIAAMRLPDEETGRRPQRRGGGRGAYATGSAGGEKPAAKSPFEAYKAAKGA